ncbi:hypothetical protein GON03_19105 [Nocardioides sp. MAH-18]|uniref:Uncharacterized protein n=1 Tax=Nocardioides agri TaxID=2682843 RepID=A0A6L6Y156_9ACTN|nr:MULTISPECIES: hypothetical protein [unclassified Nocardioides]MBA2952126.1 hypothetical protein [Nocardioides sp. CGMCC 1.13656]MVQ51295.1 hypothetical protein [Nocardioides sp. MAH-18]
MSPRTTAGAHFYAIGDECYAVAVDSTGEEVSERHSGQAWISVSLTAASHFLFVDEQGDRVSTFTLTRDAPTGVRVLVFVDDAAVCEQGIVAPTSYDQGSEVQVDWGPVWDEMA